MPLSLISKSAGCTNGSSHDGCWYLPSTNPRHCPMIHRIHTFGPPPGPPPPPHRLAHVLERHPDADDHSSFLAQPLVAQVFMLHV